MGIGVTEPLFIVCMSQSGAKRVNCLAPGRGHETRAPMAVPGAVGPGPVQVGPHAAPSMDENRTGLASHWVPTDQTGPKKTAGGGGNPLPPVRPGTKS